MANLVWKNEDLIFQTLLSANRRLETMVQRPARQSMAWPRRKERAALQELDGKTIEKTREQKKKKLRNQGKTEGGEGRRGEIQPSSPRTTVVGSGVPH
jgi:hypothetical protein